MVGRIIYHLFFQIFGSEMPKERLKTFGRVTNLFKSFRNMDHVLAAMELKFFISKVVSESTQPISYLWHLPLTLSCQKVFKMEHENSWSRSESFCHMSSLLALGTMSLRLWSWNFAQAHVLCFLTFPKNLSPIGSLYHHKVITLSLLKMIIIIFMMID